METAKAAAVLACASESARRVTGNGVTFHAGLAHINALTEILCIKIRVSPGNASTLLIRVLNLLRARRKADAESYCRQSTEASHLHGAGSPVPDH
jgi:hypothetical protein